jgi:hypothetical protein
MQARSRFNPYDWFWIVAGDESRAWSSAANGYVTDYPAERLTRIASEGELSAVLRPYGLLGPEITEQDYATAIQAHVDATAQSRGYGDSQGIATYATSTVPQWSAEAQTFIAWRDVVWLYAYQEMAKVKAGQRTKPAVSEIVAELPSIVWPT